MLHAVAIAAVLAAATPSFELQSADFTPGARLPQPLMARDCGGDNRSPALTWGGVPPGTRSFALIVHDADAPIPGGFYHWVVFDLPKTLRRIAGDGAKFLPNQGRTSAGTLGYVGPCPPPGPAHHYTFTLYALDALFVGLDTAPTGAALERIIRNHILGRATLRGVASRP